MQATNFAKTFIATYVYYGRCAIFSLSKQEGKAVFSKLELIDDDGVTEQLRGRFGKQMSELERIGFRHKSTLEIGYLAPLAPTTFLTGTIGREVMGLSLPMTVFWYHPVMASPDGAAYPFGLGIRYYTFFNDGYIHRTSACKDRESTQLKLGGRLTIANLTDRNVKTSYKRHQGFVKQHVKNDRRLEPDEALERLVRIQTNEDSTSKLLLESAMGWVGLLSVSLFTTQCAANALNLLQ